MFSESWGEGEDADAAFRAGVLTVPYSQHFAMSLQLQLPSAERGFSHQSLLSFPPTGENFCPVEFLYTSSPYAGLLICTLCV